MELGALRGLLNRTYSTITLPGQTERTPAAIYCVEVRCASTTGLRRRVVVVVKMMMMMMISMLMFKRPLLMSMVV